MASYLQMTSGGHANDNDFSTSNNTNTVNHINITPETNPSEFSKWTRQTGSLLHIASEYTGLKPVLDLIVAAIEPERIFLLSHPAMEEFEIKSCKEILLVVDEEKIQSKAALKGLIRLACMRQQDVILSFHSSNEMESGLNNGHAYYSSHCKEEFLVFSGSRYRLSQTSEEVMVELSNEITETFDLEIKQAFLFLDAARQNADNKVYNISALMLHQCLEKLYMAIIGIFGSYLPKTHNLFKLKTMAAKYYPQISEIIDESVLESLSMAHESATARYFDISEILDVVSLLDDVENVLKVSVAIFEQKIKSLFGTNDMVIDNHLTDRIN